MHIRIFAWLLTAGLVAAIDPALAAAADSGGPRCIERSFAADGAALRLSRATGAGKTDLLLDREGCPGPTAACRFGVSVRAGQMLLLGPARPGYICVFADNRAGGNAGWVPQARVAPAARRVDPAPPLTAWTGTWRYANNRIVLAVKDGGVSAAGEAYWPGKRIMPANEGAFAGAAAPAGNRLRILADRCEVEMILADRFLVVTDNRSCGGMNVSFSGIFVRRSDAAK